MSADGKVAEAEATTAPTLPGSAERTRSPARHPGLVALFPRALDGAAQFWPVRTPVTIGRGSQADIRLSDPAVSRRHATVEVADAGLRIVDLVSGHGTFADGKPLVGTNAVAAYGAVLRVGGSLLLVTDNVVAYSGPVRRLAASFLGLRNDVFAGPTLGRVWQQAVSVADLTQPTLILGETGSGKEAIARLIHASRKQPGPFVGINVAAIPEGLFESELFGHVRGSFSGAVSARIGAFRKACGGVLFIDEVADLRVDLQVKLLRALDQMSVRPVGADEEVAVDARVIAATSGDLEAACESGRFRRDLYYRLSGIVLRVPPLHERRDDTLVLAQSYLATHHPQLRLSARAAEALVLARLRGNAREVHSAVGRAAVAALGQGATEIQPAHLPELEPLASPSDNEALTAQDLQSAYIAQQGNASLAAKALGVSRSTFYNLLKRYELDPRALRTRK
jgi:transcriptional regulator of acetoin/glycerol metabolism